jgi:type VI secretion system secreted protein VgrG
MTRPLTIQLPGDLQADVVRFDAEERLAEPFQFDCSVLADARTEVALDTLLGQEATVWLEGAPGRHFSGVIDCVGRQQYDRSFVRLDLHLVPRFALLTRRLRSRVFQGQTVPQILRAVLKSTEGLNFDFELTATYQPRNYCVQYRESDFAFASRLMEDEGIRYYFRHGADGHRMVLADDPLRHPQMEEPSPVRYDRSDAGRQDQVRVRSWVKRQRITAARMTLWDDHFELSSRPLSSSAMVRETIKVGGAVHELRGGFNVDLELKDGPAGFAPHFDGVAPNGDDRPGDLKALFDAPGKTAQRRSEELAATALTISGGGNCAPFTPGVAFDLEGHPDAVGTYYLTQVAHHATQPPPHSGDGAGFHYENHFQSLPIELPYRPARRTPRPTISSVQTAVVVGPKNVPVHLDPHGRVRVRFRWGQGGEGESCWVRVAQMWAGKGWGACFWPRLGHEVAVAFEDGDPDRPVIVGSVYNADNPPPFSLPENALVAGIRSCTGAVDALPARDFNGVLFHDAPEQEHVQVHSQRAASVSSESRLLEQAGNRLMHIVGGGLPQAAPQPQAASEKEQQAAPEKGQKNSWRDHVKASASAILGGAGQHFDFTIGDAVTSVLGARGVNVVGAWSRLHFNPLSYAALAAGPVGGILGAALGGLGAALGRSHLTIGAETRLRYSPMLDLQRGPSPLTLQDGFNLGSTALASIIAGLSIGANIGVGLGPGFTDYVAWGIGAGAAKSVLLTALFTLETANAKAQAAEKEASAAEKELKLANRLAKSTVGMPLAQARDNLKEATQLLEQATRDAKEALDWAGSIALQMKPLEGKPIEVATGSYDVQAGEFLGFTAATNMHISGATVQFVTPGHVCFSSTKSTARFLLKGYYNDPDGGRMGIACCYGIGGQTKMATSAASSAYIQLSGDEALLHAGTIAPGSLRVTPNSITLDRGGLNAITVNDDECTLGAGAKSQIQLNAGGIRIEGAKIELEADVGIEELAAMFERKVSGKLTVNASIAKQ